MKRKKKNRIAWEISQKVKCKKQSAKVSRCKNRKSSGLFLPVKKAFIRLKLFNQCCVIFATK